MLYSLVNNAIAILQHHNKKMRVVLAATATLTPDG
jgi:hypothetical protein